MSTQFNNTEVKTETSFAQVINDDELMQASGGFPLLAMAIFNSAFLGGFFKTVADS